MIILYIKFIIISNYAIICLLLLKKYLPNKFFLLSTLYNSPEFAVIIVYGEIPGLPVSCASFGRILMGWGLSPSFNMPECTVMDKCHYVCWFEFSIFVFVPNPNGNFQPEWFIEGYICLCEIYFRFIFLQLTKLSLLLN